MIFNNDATYINDQILAVLDSYYNMQNIKLFALKSGMNNITRVVHHQSSKYNLRIYCNHTDRSKVQFEHDVLMMLSKQLTSVKVPIPINTKDGKTIAQLADGRLVALYHYIDGEQQATKNCLMSLVKATAQVSQALSALTIQTNSEYSPYYDLATNYPSFTSAEINNLHSEKNLPLQTIDKLNYLLNTRHKLELQRATFSQLPHQLIHGDINFSNAVTEKEEVIAILDFEFVTYDIKVMELAVLFTEYFKLYPKFDFTVYKQMITIFDTYHHLSQEEMELLPQLISLRSVDVAMHFLTRYINNQDNNSVMIKIAEESYDVVKMIEGYLFI